MKRLPYLWLVCVLPVTSTASAVPQPAQIAGGNYFTCGVTPDGGAKCWGKNDRGQLGTGLLSNSTTAQPVSSLSSGVLGISAGESQACALMSGGGVKCWGTNAYGQLGSGSGVSDSNVPVDVAGSGTTFSAIALARSAGSSNHSCAITSAGGVKCWGSNNYGQLGDGTKVDANTPVDVAGLSDRATAVAIGSVYSCAVLENGSAQCWGANVGNIFNNNTITDSLVPVTVSGSLEVAALSAGGSHVSLVTTAGAAYSLGSNFYGQLGNGSTVSSRVPVPVTGLGSGVTNIASGVLFTCATSADGGLSCWGTNGLGELGIGTTTARVLTPQPVASNVTEIGAGISHACAVIAGTLNCWGGNGGGQLGTGVLGDSALPAPVIGFYVPEPSSFALVAIGLGAIALPRRRDLHLAAFQREFTKPTQSGAKS